MISAAAGRTDVCLLLLEEGADPLLQDLEGRTASQLAELEGHRDLAVRLSKTVNLIHAQETEDHGAEIALDDNAFGWEAEDEFISAVSSHPSSEVSTEIQIAISAYRPKQEHDEWSFASISLPSGTQSQPLAFSAGARSILAAALAEGSISASRLRMAWPAATAAQFQLLCAAMREAGAQIRFDRNEAIWSRCGEVTISPSDTAAIETVIDQVRDEPMVGERGETLSGGQRQRIAIARADPQQPHSLARRADGCARYRIGAAGHPCATSRRIIDGRGGRSLAKKGAAHANL